MGFQSRRHAVSVSPRSRLRLMDPSPLSGVRACFHVRSGVSGGPRLAPNVVRH
ncbi:MAG: hypothetical protein ACRDPD_34720 [Streptosporangiaceae bacterium]